MIAQTSLGMNVFCSVLSFAALPPGELKAKDQSHNEGLLVVRSCTDVLEG